MSKFTTTDFVSGKEILKLTDYVSIAVTVDDAGIVADANGKKIVPAGTIIGGKAAKRLDDPTQRVVKKNDANAEGVLLYNVDVTYGAKDGAMILWGFIDKTKLPEAPAAAAITALPMIKFMA